MKNLADILCMIGGSFAQKFIGDFPRIVAGAECDREEHSCRGGLPVKRSYGELNNAETSFRWRNQWVSITNSG